MRFRQLEYQDRALATLDAYIDHLKQEKQRSDSIAALATDRSDLALPVPDFTREAWKAMRMEGRLPKSRASIPFSPRKDGCGRPVPNTVLKVPTGGGKTWLAVSGVSRIMGRYLGRNTGFVLWIVPNDAIYRQTLKNLRDRQHPYRQALDRAAAGHVQIMEKTDRLDARDVETNLCVMLLMLQAANKENKETLKLFRDRGNVHGFFPPEGEQQAHEEALDRTPNLDGYQGMFPMVKDSPGNALRIIRPVVVVDEGHRVISDLAFKTLYGFNPCFVLELTATPKDVKARSGKNPRPARFANLLVDVTGRELDREGMIKIPLNLEPRQGSDWRATLNAAVAKLDMLNAEADKFRADTDRYIRPIMLVQVERTGKDQRESGHIHAEDVREQLLTMGFAEAEVAIKTAEQNDLKEPENQDLLSRTNRVRAIITKQALQEGWDCPFAYVLCALAASSGMTAMTQLVGRILRQPGAERTGVAALDECHVITHHAETKRVVEGIKKGLERDGLGDLHPLVSQDGDAAETGNRTRKIHRRRALASTAIYLPRVMVADDDGVRALDYEADVLSRIDWRGFDPEHIAAGIPENAQAADAQLLRMGLTEDGDVSETIAGTAEVAAFDPVHAVRMMLDIVPNPFLGREIVGRLLDALRGRNFDDRKLGGIARLVVEELRKGLDAERDSRAEALFKEGVEGGRIQFRLRLDGRDWRMPSQLDTSEPPGSRQFLTQSGGPLQRSLFETVYRTELNLDEQDVAVYLDGDAAVTWWHRNVARTQYGIQGWRKRKIYPDFIFAVREDGATGRIVVLETKGDHLDNLDTAYKREVLDFLSGNFAWDDSIPAGQLELVADGGQTVECALILMSEWRTKLPNLLLPTSGV